MKVARNAAEVLVEHTTLELERIDRLYLNVYVPLVQSLAGVSYFFRQVRGNPGPTPIRWTRKGFRRWVSKGRSLQGAGAGQ